MMTPERVKRLIECYGASPHAWPEHEREAALAHLQQSPELQALAELEEQLDAALANARRVHTSTQPAADVAALRRRILDQLPARMPLPHTSLPHSVPTQTTSQSSSVTQGEPPRGHRLPRHRQHWMGAAGAALAAAMLLMLVIEKPQSPANDNAQSQLSFEQWAWEETTGEAPVDNVDVNNPVQLGMLELGFAPEEL